MIGIVEVPPIPLFFSFSSLPASKFIPFISVLSSRSPHYSMQHGPINLTAKMRWSILLLTLVFFFHLFIYFLYLFVFICFYFMRLYLFWDESMTKKRYLSWGRGASRQPRAMRGERWSWLVPKVFIVFSFPPSTPHPLTPLTQSTWSSSQPLGPPILNPLLVHPTNFIFLYIYILCSYGEMIM